MDAPSEFYRVKVQIDGGWVSAGDFRDVSQAKARARFINWHMERKVEVRDQEGTLIHSEDLVLGSETKHTALLEESSGNTVALD